MFLVGQDIKTASCLFHSASSLGSLVIFYALLQKNGVKFPFPLTNLHQTLLFPKNKPLELPFFETTVEYPGGVRTEKLFSVRPASERHTDPERFPGTYQIVPLF